MLKRHSLFAAYVAIIVTVLISASAHAFVTSRYNDLTFNQPVALPGVTLGAGTYRFEFIDSSRSIVLVSDPHSRRVYLARHTNRVERPRGLDRDQLVTFGEAPAGAPPRINVWFPIGESDGRQFVY